MAMFYLDRYLATLAVKMRKCHRSVFRLAAMTALYLAIKLFDPGELPISSLIGADGAGRFTAKHIVLMEHTLLQSLKWYITPPTSFAFCRELMRLISVDIGPHTHYNVTELTRFLTELSVTEYWFVTKKPSSIALASIFYALQLLQGPRRVDPRYKVELLHRVVDIGMDIANGEIIECYERLREIYQAGGYTAHLRLRAAGGQ